MDIPEIRFRSEKTKPLKKGTLEYFSAKDFSLSKREILKAQKELFETDDKKVRQMDELRKKLANDDIKCRTDTTYLLRFLRVRKYDCARSYQMLKEGYLFRKKHPEISHIPSNLETLLNLDIFVWFPYTDENGNIILYFDLAKWNHKETSFMEILQIINVVNDILSMNPRTQVNGVIGIWDVKEVNKYHVTSILTSFGIGAFCFYMQNVFPWRVKGLLVINAGRLSQLFYKMARPFLSKKISERVVLLGSDEGELHQYVNPVLLPKSLGGELEKAQCSVTQNVLDNIPYLKYERSFILTE